MENTLPLRNMTAIYICKGEEMLLLYRIGSRVVEPSWCGIGGHFEKEELNDPQSCVLREFGEETGIAEDALRNLSLRYVTLRLKNGEIRQNYYYFAEIAECRQFFMDSEEGALEWVPLDEILHRNMPLTAKQMLTHYMQIGRFNETVYCGVTGRTQMTFTPLEDF
ncbi:MAG: NUDIX domain-containing protein [Emergencia sp.]